MKEFSGIFDGASDMWNVLSSQFDEVSKNDTEMLAGLSRLGETISRFNETQAILKKEDGINIEEAIKLVEKKPEGQDEEYSFILFVILKNLEHSGLISINRKAQRIARKALKDYETKNKK